MALEDLLDNEAGEGSGEEELPAVERADDAEAEAEHEEAAAVDEADGAEEAGDAEEAEEAEEGEDGEGSPEGSPEPSDAEDLLEDSSGPSQCALAAGLLRSLQRKC